uniref:Retrotransposon gag domain-containing protein n=2 Tax=Moniliophthora roreri TaxID=221103 RepID=A0A0W0FDD6_MONRR
MSFIKAWNVAGLGITYKETIVPSKTEQQLEQDIVEAEEQQHGLQTQSILNPGGRSPLPESHPPTETAEELTGTKKTLTPLFTTVGSEERDSTDSTSQHTSKKEGLDTSITSSLLVEEQDPFKRLLTALKNSPRSKKQLQIEEMAEDKKPSGSRPKAEPEVEEMKISTAVPIQVVAAEKEVKAALPQAFTGQQKEAKRFLREVLLYITLNPKTFTNDRTKKLFLLSYMTDGPGEFWKNKKTDFLLANDKEAEKVTWSAFIEDFKTSFEPLDTALEAQMKLRDLKMKQRADEYTYQFIYLAKQTGYNDAAQVKAFKQGLPRSLMLKIMTRPEGKLETIKD